MNVIHYMLGLPPLRKGGLPKYALSLIMCQKEMGYDVKIVVPGPFDKSSKTSIKNWVSFEGIPCYRIKNALPVSNEYGIKEIDAFTRPITKTIFAEWLDKNQVDVIHVHSAMGLPVEFLLAAREKSIKVIMTTHDYFGLCPKIDLIKRGELCDGSDWSGCAECCQNAHSVKRLQFMLSDIYWWYCNQAGLFNSIHRGTLVKVKEPLKKVLKRKSEWTENVVINNEKVNYDALKAYYLNLFSCVDLFHFNSEQTAEIFRRNLGKIKGVVIDIMNDDIYDDRVEKTYGEVLQIGYIGEKAQHKGFDFMADKLQQIYDEGRKRFVCHTFMMEDAKEYPFMVNHGPYRYGDQGNVFKLIDVLVVPSMWRETYGMVVLEAISKGVPVLISEYVGAKTLVERYPGIGKIFSVCGDDFVTVMKDIYDERDKLSEMNREILKINFDFDMKKHARKVEELYAKC